METKHIIWIIIGVFAFLLLVIGGCVVGGVLFVNSNIDTVTKAATASSAEEALAICSEKSGISKNTCLIMVTSLYINDTQYKDASLCDAIDMEEYKFSCKVMYAGYWEDESLCSGMELMEAPDGKLMCTAAARNDATLCEQASTAEIKDACVKLITEDLRKAKE